MQQAGADEGGKQHRGLAQRGDHGHWRLRHGPQRDRVGGGGGRAAGQAGHGVGGHEGEERAAPAGQHEQRERDCVEHEQPDDVAPHVARQPRAGAVDHRVHGDHHRVGEREAHGCPGRSVIQRPVAQRNDAAADEQDAEPGQQAGQFAQQQHAEQRGQQRRGAAHQGVGERQVAGAVGLHHEVVVGQMRGERGGNVRPRRRCRQRQHEEEWQRHQSRAGDDGCRLQQHVGRALDQRVPAGVQECGEQDRKRDLEAQCAAPFSRASACAHICCSSVPAGCGRASAAPCPAQACMRCTSPARVAASRSATVRPRCTG